MSQLLPQSKFIPPGLGWQRDLPDPRDYTAEHPEVLKLLARLLPADSPPPSEIDLRQDDEGSYFSPPDDQGALNSSSAFACLALVEYFERKTLGQTFEGSPLFLYEMARRLTGVTGESGAGIRSTLKALCRYGAPPESMRPYIAQQVDQDHDLSLLGFRNELDGLLYFRLDSADSSGENTLSNLKSFLAAGFPVTLGFSVPRSLTQDDVIPFRPAFDSYRGGQSVLVVGYHDERLGGSGALLIRSSWGTAWGDAGYGWLPYSLVTRHQAADCWTMFRSKWAVSTMYRPQRRDR